MRKFYDLHIVYNKENAEEMVSRALELGYSGVCLVKEFLSFYDFKGYLKKMSPLKEKFNIDIISGVLLKEKNKKELLEKLIKIRRKVELIFVDTQGNYKLNRFVLERKEVDIICNFWDEKGLGIDHICLRKARENFILFEIPLFPLLNKKKRKEILKKYFALLNIFKKSNTPFILTSNASNKLEVRRGRDLVSLITSFSFDLEFSLNSITKMPFLKIEENRKKLKQPVLGVEVEEEYEEE